MALDIRKLTSLNDETRQAVAEAFDALEEWRVEIGAANERCVTKVFDKVTKAYRSLGWPEEAIKTAHEQFRKASSIQCEMIEQAMNLWQQQLQAQNWRSRTPSTLQAQTPSQFSSSASDLTGTTMNPFMLWMEAAQAWQRAWVSTMSGGALSDRSSKSPTRTAEPSTSEGRPSRS
jgi:hypothetical protein